MPTRMAAAARAALVAAWAMAAAGGAGAKPPPTPDQLCGTTRIKGSNCGGTACRASGSCECVMHSVMSAECSEDQPFLKALPGLHVHSFRIPSIVRTDTALVAFAEARQGAYGSGTCVPPLCKGTGFEPTDDMGPKTIAYKRSTNAGATWSPLQYVPGLYKAGWVVGNPTAVWDAEAKMLLLHVLNSTLVPAPFNDSMTSTGFTLQLTTKDGKTWTEPLCLNRFLGARGVSGIAPGPGNAIQLRSSSAHKGRLLFPGWGSLCFDPDSCSHGTRNGSLTYAAVYYSDDHGASWQVGPGAALPADLHGTVAEPTLAELTDGSVLLNMRSICSPSNGGELKNASICDATGIMAARMTSRSSDFGMTFAAPRFQKDLPSPNDQGSSLRGMLPVSVAAARSSSHFPIYFSGPYSRTSRSNISIMASYDDGHSFPATTVVYPKAAKYSCLSYLNESHISLLMEAHNSKVSAFDITFMAVTPPSAAVAPVPPPAPANPSNVVTAACTNATDCTTELQAALASGAERLIIPKLPDGRSWVVTPLRLHSHQTIVMERGEHEFPLPVCTPPVFDLLSGSCADRLDDTGAEILAKRGAFQSKYTGLLTGAGIENVSILAEPGAQIRMWRQDYANATPGVVYAKAEWRHGVNLIGVDNVKISGLRVTETGGDGLQITSCEKGCAPAKPGRPPVQTASTNVQIVDCVFDRNYRQGISVESAGETTPQQPFIINFPRDALSFFPCSTTVLTAGRCRQSTC
eukprot:SAG22_NODE_1887_length_3375_cov_1.948413_1_plen_746_part_10